MSKKIRIQLGAFFILAALVYMGLQGAHNFTSYFVNVKTFQQRVAMLEQHSVRVQGTLLSRSVHYDAAHDTLSFTLTAQGATLPVVYRGAMPNEQFKNARAIVEGHESGGVFHATKLMIQCPNHYVPPSPNA